MARNVRRAEKPQVLALILLGLACILLTVANVLAQEGENATPSSKYPTHQVVEGRTEIIVHRGKTPGTRSGIKLNAGDQVKVKGASPASGFFIIECPDAKEEDCNVAWRSSRDRRIVFLELVSDTDPSSTTARIDAEDPPSGSVDYKPRRLLEQNDPPGNPDIVYGQGAQSNSSESEPEDSITFALGSTYLVAPEVKEIVVYRGTIKTTTLEQRLKPGDTVTVLGDYTDLEKLILCPDNSSLTCLIQWRESEHSNEPYLIPSPETTTALAELLGPDDEPVSPPPVAPTAPEEDYTNGKERLNPPTPPNVQFSPLPPVRPIDFTLPPKAVEPPPPVAETLNEMFANPPSASSNPVLRILPDHERIMVRRIANGEVGDSVGPFRMDEGTELPFLRVWESDSNYAVVSCPPHAPIDSECLVAIRDPSNPSDYWMEVVPTKIPETPPGLAGQELKVLPSVRARGGLPVRYGSVTDAGRDTQKLRLKPDDKITFLGYTAREGWIRIRCPNELRDRQNCFVQISDPNLSEELFVTLAKAVPQARYDQSDARKNLVGYAEQVIRGIANFNEEYYRIQACVAQIQYLKVKDEEELKLAAIRDARVRAVCTDGVQTIAHPEGHPVPIEDIFAMDEMPPIGACINGDPNRDIFHRQLYSRTEGVSDIEGSRFLAEWRKYKQLEVEMRDWLNSCQEHGIQESKLGLQLENVAAEFTSGKLPRLKKECIAASLKRSFPTDGYWCSNNSGGNLGKLNGPGNNGPCVTEDIADYLAFIFNTVNGCLSPENEPLDVRLLLKKINGETGFSFWSENAGGVGIGQLVQIGLKEVSKPGENGYGYKRDVLNGTNENPECKLVKDILDQNARSDKGVIDCELLSLGEGVARDLFYSTALYLHNRDYEARSSFYAYNMVRKAGHIGPDGRPKKEYRDYLALAGYGPCALQGMKRLGPERGESIEAYQARLAAINYRISYEIKRRGPDGDTFETRTCDLGYIDKMEDRWQKETLRFLCCDGSVPGVCNRENVDAKKFQQYCRGGLSKGAAGVEFTPAAISGDVCFE